jgi:tRNA(Ile)-lysidine synthase
MRRVLSRNEPQRKASASAVPDSLTIMSRNTVVAEFTAAMERFAPFENSPHLAVAVSGGADSMALCLLAHDWAVARGGRVTALTVDHGLRPASAEEAAQVGSWMSGCGIEHHILRWRGEKPTSAVQNSARVARYRLLCEWCRQENVLHLLLGHHADDQSETVLHRLVRGSGMSGLSGMSALVETSEVRLLRPLLSCRPAALRFLLTERGQEWLEDPSNQDPRFARTHVRAVLPHLAAVGLTRSVLLAAVAQMAETGSILHEAVVEFLARSCRVHRTGFAQIERAAMATAPSVVAVKALARLVMMIGGSARECQADAVWRAYERLFRGGLAVTTLGRCLLLTRGQHLLVYRERRNLPSPCVLPPDDALLWDGRFRLRAFVPDEVAAQLYVRPVGKEDLQMICSNSAKLAGRVPPALVRGTLPVLCDEGGLAIAPHFDYVRDDLASAQSMVVEVAWRPRKSVTGPGYFLA